MTENIMYAEYTRNRIAQLRIQKGLSERELSLEINKSFTYIHDLNKRRALPTMGVFFDICNELGVTPELFFNDSVKYPSQSQLIISELERLLCYEEICAYRQGLTKVTGDHVKHMRQLILAFSETHTG